MELKILWEDEYYIAIYKPAGLLVHRSKIAADAKEFAIQLLNKQIGCKVYPCHRLDRKTSGILLFAKQEDALKKIRMEWENLAVKKEYQALVRGFTEEKNTIIYPLINEKGVEQDATTAYETLINWECDFPSGKFQTSRYSLMKLSPVTGRYHQIRKHLAHIFHPIIGDRPHGCNKQNKLFLELMEMNQMLLTATKLSWRHPFTKQEITIKCELSPETQRTIAFLDLKKIS